MPNFTQLVEDIEKIKYEKSAAEALIESLFAERLDTTLDNSFLTSSTVVMPTQLSLTKRFNDIRDIDTQENLLEFALRTNNEKLVALILNIIEFAPPIPEWVSLCLLKAIQNCQYSLYDLIAKKFHDLVVVKPEVAQQIEIFALRYGSYRFIYQVLDDKPIDVNSLEVLKALIENPHDITYFLKDFSKDSFETLRDNEGNNALHIALKGNNHKNFLYMTNHFGLNLLYEANELGMTPIDLVFDQIARSSKPHDFKNLIYLDQVGADLTQPKHQKIMQDYRESKENLKHYVLARQVKTQTDINAISFNGGGTKGQAFIAALKKAESEGVVDLSKVDGYGGTSAGAIVGAVFSLGYTVTEAENILNQFDFKALLTPSNDKVKVLYDTNIKTWLAYFNQGAYLSLVTDIFLKLFSEGIRFYWNGASPFIDAVREVLGKTGLFKTTYLRESLVRYTAEKLKGTDLEGIDPQCVTFKDLKDKPYFKELVVYGTNLSTGLTEKYSAETNPDLPFIDGVIISICIPIFFECSDKSKVVVDAEGKRKRVIPDVSNGNGSWFCDGGVLKNDTVDAFDINGFNERALNFMLVSSDNKAKFEHDKLPKNKEIVQLLDVISALIATQRSVEKALIHTDPRNKSRIIYIDTKNVGTVDFDNAVENRKILYPAGEDGVIDYLNRRTIGSYPLLRHEMIMMLIHYGCAEASIGGQGYLVQIRPGQQISPDNILRTYSAANDDEVVILRSFVNPNCKDENGNTALAIARQLHFIETERRLLMAGANPASIELRHYQPAAYFQLGESFIRNCQTNERLLAHASEFSELERLRQENARLNSENDGFKMENTEIKSEIARMKLPRKFVRTTDEPVKAAISELENHLDDLRRDVAVLTMNNRPHDEKGIHIKNQKILGIEQIIFDLKSDFNKSSREIINLAVQQNPLLRSGFFSKTARICDKIIGMEESLINRLSYVARN